MIMPSLDSFFFFSNTATTKIYTLSLHDALPISRERVVPVVSDCAGTRRVGAEPSHVPRSEEHTSELQSRLHLVCRLLLEKKKIETLTRSSQLVPLARSNTLLAPPISRQRSRANA